MGDIQTLGPTTDRSVSLKEAWELFAYLQVSEITRNRIYFLIKHYNMKILVHAIYAYASKVWKIYPKICLKNIRESLMVFKLYVTSVRKFYAYSGQRFQVNLLRFRSSTLFYYKTDHNTQELQQFKIFYHFAHLHLHILVMQKIHENMRESRKRAREYILEQ